MTTTKFNITQVHRITGKSPTTIRKHIKKGDLSCERDANGNPLVDGAELTRVYGVGVDDFKRASPPSKNASTEQTGDQASSQLTSSVQARLDEEIQERKRERERLEQQYDELQSVLKRVQEGHERALLLIENRAPGRGDLEKSIRNIIEEKLTDQETAFEKRVTELQEDAKNEAIQELKDISWPKVFWRLLRNKAE